MEITSKEGSRLYLSLRRDIRVITNIHHNVVMVNITVPTNYFYLKSFFYLKLLVNYALLFRFMMSIMWQDKLKTLLLLKMTQARRLTAIPPDVQNDAGQWDSRSSIFIRFLNIIYTCIKNFIFIIKQKIS